MSHRLLSVLALSFVTACAEVQLPESDLPLDNFGVAVQSNMAAQIIAKDGEVTTLGPAPGVRRSLAVERYQTDRIQQPAQVSTRGE